MDLETLLVRSLKQLQTHKESRAKKAAALAVVENAKSIAEDYARRLAERARFRDLLNSVEQDGMRFRYWFGRSQCEKSLNDWREFIDNEIAVKEQK